MNQLTTGKCMARNDPERVVSALPLPILRALAYRAGLDRHLPLATYTSANKLISDWITAVVRHALTLMENRRSMKISYLDMRHALMSNGGDFLKDVFANEAAFKPLATFPWNGNGGGSTVRELYDMMIDKSGLAESVEDDDLVEIVDELACAERDSDDDADPTAEEVETCTDLVTSMNARARAARDEYAALVPPTIQDGAENNIVESYEQWVLQQKADDDDSDYVQDDVDEDEHDDDDEEGSDEDGDDDEEGSDGNAASEDGDGINTLNLWSSHSHPRLNAATMAYNVNGMDYPVCPSWIDELTSGTISDEGFSEQDHKLCASRSLDEDHSLCPIFVVRDIMRESMQNFKCDCLITRDALSLFHRCLERFAVSLFEIRTVSPAGHVFRALTKGDSAAEHEALKDEVVQLELSSKQASAENEALKGEFAQLKRSLSQTTARGKMAQASLKADVAMARAEAAQANAALVALQQAANAECEEELSADESVVAVVDTPVAPRDSRSSLGRKQSTQTPNPALCAGSASSAMTDASDASASETPVDCIATGTMRKRTHANNPAVGDAKRLRFVQD